MMTAEQMRRLRELTLNPDESFTPADHALLPGLHDCPEWDGPIFSELPEWDACTCPSSAEAAAYGGGYSPYDP